MEPVTLILTVVCIVLCLLVFPSMALNFFQFMQLRALNREQRQEYAKNGDLQREMNKELYGTLKDVTHTVGAVVKAIDSVNGSNTEFRRDVLNSLSQLETRVVSSMGRIEKTVINSTTSVDGNLQQNMGNDVKGTSQS